MRVQVQVHWARGATDMNLNPQLITAAFAAWAEPAAMPGKQPASQPSQAEPESQPSQGGAALESSQEQAASPYEQYRHK